jgi:acyl carrier protein
MQLADSLADIEAVVRPHLKFLEADAPLGAEDNLGEAGLDSMASIDLLLDLEERFDITIQYDLLTENPFASLSEFAKLIDVSSDWLGFGFSVDSNSEFRKGPTTLAADFRIVGD